MDHCVEMESLGEDRQFEDWCNSSFVHWDEDNMENSHFGDWTGFNESLGEDAKSTPQDKHDVSHECEAEGGKVVNQWTVFHDCFQLEDTVQDKDIMEILPLSQLLHNFSHIPPQLAGPSRESVNFYFNLLCEPENVSFSKTKANFYFHKKLVEMLQLNTLKDKHFEDLGVKEMESSTALIETKLTAPTLGQNKPGFLYQISHQWLNQYKQRLQTHQDKKDLL